ncbi:MAG: type IV secretion system DNA-binding domain-containing protein [Isosphaeraceae bacterium]
MLTLIRAAVRFVAVFLLPLVFAGLAYPVFVSWVSLGTLAAAALSLALLLAYAALASFEMWVYVRELRSVVPKPVSAALAFISRLSLLFLGTDAAVVSTLALSRAFGPLLASALAVFSGMMAYAALSYLLLSRHREMIRGRRFSTYRSIFFESLWTRGEIIFGNIRLPWGSAVKHFLILGVTGAGKTMVFQLLMQSTIKGRIGRGRDQRGILFDNKSELVPLLHALGVPYKIAHPFDRRGVAVDLRSMVQTHTNALEIAAILMPQAKDASPDPFWINAPRSLLAAVLTSLRIGARRNGEDEPSPIDWDFRDVVIAMSGAERIREIIERNPETKDLANGYFDDARLTANVMATVQTAMMYFRPVAACWHRAREKINLTDAVWGKDEFILVLGNDEESRMALDALNRAIVTRHGQLALKRPQSKTRRIWYWLDEFPDLKQIAPDVMTGLLTKGRSKGIAVVLGAQSLLGVVGEYGREAGKIILSQCQNVAILGLGDLDDDTSEFAMRAVGQTEQQEVRESESTQGTLFARRTTSAQPARREVILSSEFADLPETSKENGLPGFFRTRSIRGFWGTVIPGAWLSKILLPPARDVAAIEERPPEEHELLPWGPADYERLALKPPEEATAEIEAAPQKPFRVYRGGKQAAVA